ncbi:thioredoxin [Parvularcula sp. ZS-1/3]|uniref:Thioredoxin n=1 Tax=Parvularcula mediterranea TaxID=2732508 RepID=A0A7Y3RL49_9PROT|nr:thioredoxin [Parvularcula mediterranea]NNU16097.1 thioredoxin [Parvularcula mediterranea]
MTTKTVTDKSFADDVLGAEGPVLVDFWATWCGPCKQIAPALEEIAGEKAGSLTVAKVDIDTNPDTPGQYGVRGVPTLMLFKDGELVATKVGAAPKTQLDAWIKESVGV